MTHTERIAAIRAREAAATPGPWLLEPNENSYRAINSERGDEVIFDGSAGEYGGPFTNWNADPPFIAHARADIPYLLKRVEALEASLGEAIECIEDWGAYVPDYLKDKHDFQGDIDRMTAIKEGTTDAD